MSVQPTTPRRARPLLALALALACLAPQVARGQGISDVIAYEGMLELDGAPVENALAMRFILSSPNGTEIWRSERSDEATSSCAQPCQVDFYRGRFSVLLGEHTALPQSVWAQDSVLVSIEVRDAAGAWHALDGVQTIEPTPYALWSTDANELSSEYAVSIGGLSVTGPITAETVSSGGRVESTGGALQAAHLAISGTVSTVGNASTGPLGVTGVLDLDDNQLHMSTSGDDGADGIALDQGTNGDVIVNQSSTFSGGVRMRDGYVSGTATASGDVHLDSGQLLMGSGARIAADRSLFLMRVVTGATPHTYISTTDYNCWVGGWAMTGADINEVGTGDPAHAYTYRDNGEWRVSADLHSHNEHERPIVLVVCMQTDASTLNDWF